MKEMMVRSFGVPLVLLLVGLGGCATTSPEGPAPEPRGDGACEAAPAQAYLGEKATGDLGAELLRVSGAQTLRWVPPRTAITMDFRADRLTVSYDDAMMITKVACG